MFSTKPPKSIVPKKTNFDFMDLDPLEVARQMTLIDSELYRAIRPHECMGQPWNKPNATTFAPNITKMIQRFSFKRFAKFLNAISGSTKSVTLLQRKLFKLKSIKEEAKYCKELLQ
jgi:hypothetical protein